MEKLTRITLPGTSLKFCLYGENSPKDIITHVREYALQERKKIEAVETATDKEFQIDVIAGLITERFVSTIQPSSRHERREEREGGDSAEG